MFTIDLLKGQGIARKSGPGNIAVGVIAFAPPVIAAAVLLTVYVIDDIAITVLKQQTDFYQKKIETSPEAVNTKTAFEQKKNAINACLSEATSAVGMHTQWSPVLATLAKHMPDSLLLTRLEVYKEFVNLEVPAESDQSAKTTIRAPERKLRITVHGPADSAGSEAVSRFEYDLRVSRSMNSELSEIRRIAQQESMSGEGKRVVSYEIDCVFNPGL